MFAFPCNFDTANDPWTSNDVETNLKNLVGRELIYINFFLNFVLCVLGLFITSSFFIKSGQFLFKQLHLIILTNLTLSYINYLLSIPGGFCPNEIREIITGY